MGFLWRFCPDGCSLDCVQRDLEQSRWHVQPLDCKEGDESYEMEIARGIRNANSMTTTSSDVVVGGALEAVEMDIIDSLMAVCVHMRTSDEDISRVDRGEHFVSIWHSAWQQLASGPLQQSNC